MRASSYAEISAEAERGIELAAAELGAKVAEVRGYFLAGDDWDAETGEDLADLIVQCWQEDAASGLHEFDPRDPLAE
jgi:hypothetical protein